MNELRASLKMRRYVILVDIFIILLGSAAIAWASVTIPIFRRQQIVETVAQHIIRGEQYSSNILLQQISDVEQAKIALDCDPITLRSSVVIRLRIVEEIRRQRKSSDSAQMQALEHSIRDSIRCSPAEPFVWLAFYWVTKANDGLGPQAFKYLELSYELGPSEGWIALTRNPMAFDDYAKLPSNLKARAVSEFLELIKSGLTEQAADILKTSAWPMRNELLPRLAGLPIKDRELFSQAIYDRGLPVTIPGVKPPDTKPWQH
jgi:hypothetical protein